MLLNIKDKLYNSIKQYCDLNDIGDIETFINSLLSKNFMIEKYGEKPEILVKKEINTVDEETEKEEKPKPKMAPRSKKVEKVEEKPKEEETIEVKEEPTNIVEKVETEEKTEPTKRKTRKRVLK